ncbi:EF-P beta-lysylation protein EpmB [Candidatus Methylospira mobilis]|uniref:L-lysine 2,3-aminomutase n=1 Tax=Candidatus Methylospira mobilis TaxID=1808979 RepID=A0A5Q0BI72_9GAMM|nr:EF-P beta-lysylation protein EpmB [Candidatus Methylospira mobilis]QFY41901.1 EF-P beta-lysylation protein EpmB [Candidatus Methylospira mobilis]
MPKSDWQAELASSYTRVEDLLAFLELPSLPFASTLKTPFPFRVTADYARRMRKGDACDPLLRQVLPLGEELLSVPGYSADPVGDLDALVLPGLLHKYRGRALLLATPACAIHCRYCFRRDFPYADGAMTRQREAEIISALQADAGVNEVILSGGDPLLLHDERLAALIEAIAAISHIRRLRIHTRLPVVLPSRISDDLIALLRQTRLQCVTVIHANHPAELDRETAVALSRLPAEGGRLLNQSVLLRGVNDNAETLAELSETLFSKGVTPYYLHLLDKAQGTAHFDVPLDEALKIHEELRRLLPGYLVPRLVREEAGKPYKTLV